MTAINRIGLWFTIIGGNLWGGIIARYGGENVAPAPIVLVAILVGILGMALLVYEQKPTKSSEESAS
jgi:hypothetical protein